MDKLGMLDGKQKHTITAEDNTFNAPVLQKTAEDCATLLKNQGNVLPITTADLGSTAFIGPTGGILVSIGQAGERAQGIPDHQVGPVPALEKIAGRKVTYAVANDFDGAPIPASALSNEYGNQGDPDRRASELHERQRQSPAAGNFLHLDRHSHRPERWRVHHCSPVPRIRRVGGDRWQLHPQRRRRWPWRWSRNRSNLAVDRSPRRDPRP
jgi:hypothetical protein